VDAQNGSIEDDSCFVTRCRQGEVEAFAPLVRRHQKKMLNLAYRMIGDYEEACDVVQEAFLAAFRSIKTFREEARFSTWLGSIVLNESRNHLKKKAGRLRLEEKSLDDPETIKMNDLNGFSSPEPSALERLEKSDRERLVQTALQTLDQEQREVLVLRDLQGHSYETIGLMLKVPLGTVRSRLFRARNSLKDKLVTLRGV
jgi:RNA polymerase sigma-70 factor (ECF subfamily)